MVALILAMNSEGDVVGRCDAKCYEAQSAECDCICGGRNHGAGLEKARENNAERFLGTRDAEAWARAHGLDPAGVQVAAQTDLFPFGNERSTRELRKRVRS